MMHARARLALLLALVLLVVAGVAVAQTSNATSPRPFRGEGGGHGPAAQLSMIAFVAAGVFVPLNLWRRLWLPRVLGAGHEAREQLARAGAWLKRSGVWWHMILGTATLGIGTYHGLTAGQSNWELWTGMALLAVLLALGTIIHWRWIPTLARQRTAMLTVKWGITIVCIGLLLYGHSLTHHGFQRD